jgi:hypothetical protein
VRDLAFKDFRFQGSIIALGRKLCRCRSFLLPHNAEEFVCDYVGMTQAAKDYGAPRMFLLRRCSG